LAKAASRKQIDAALEKQAAIDAEVARKADEYTRAAIGTGLATAFGGMTVSAKLEFPRVLRQGNLSKADRQLVNVLMGEKADMTSLTAGTGGAWVPTGLGTELMQMVDVASNLRPYLQRWGRLINMPTDPYNIPGVSAHSSIEFRTENNAVNATSAPTTTSSQLNAKKLIAEIDFPTELDEDSIIPVVPALKADLATAFAQQEEKAIIFGDDTVTAANNIDKNIGTASSQTIFNGLWYTALNGTATWFISYGTDWPTSLRAARRAMGKYGVDPETLLYILPTGVYLSCVTSSGFLTADKVLGQAGALTGLMPGGTAGIGKYGKFDGAWIAVTGGLPETDANGVVLTTAASNTKFNALVVNPTRIYLGQRRGFTIKPWEDVKKDQQVLVATMRIGLLLPDGGTAGSIVGVKNGS
jgi:hypothetical protein